MNILYGVQATGNGHINKSREIVKELKSRNHNVRVIFSGREKGFFDIQEFRPYRILKGITFSTKNGKINYWSTLRNINLYQFYRDINTISRISSNYDLIISDFEPITARVSKISGIPSIGLSHQSSFQYKNIPLGFYNPLALFITRHFAKCDINIGVHWDNFGNINIIPPIIPKGLKNNIKKNKYLVYLAFENNKYIEILNQFKDYNFYVYTSEKFKSKENVFYMPFSRTTFLNDLQESEGIITNSGFQLISEALTIGRKILVKPVKKQFEQESNAECIKKLGLGMATKKINKKVIENFLLNCDSIKLNYPDVPKEFVDWIEEKSFDPKELSNKLWGKI